MIFLGNPRSQASYYARESKNTMTTPLLVLAFFSIVVGWAGIPDGFPILSHLTPSWIERLFTSPVFTESVVLSGLNPGHSAVSEYFLWAPMIIGVALSLLGMTIGWLFYCRIPLEAGDEDPLEVLMTFLRCKWLYRLMQNKFYIDEIYVNLLIKPVTSGVNVTAIFDTKIVDWLVISIGRVATGFSRGAQKVDDAVFDPDLSSIKRLSLTSIVEWFDGNFIDEIVTIFGFLGGITSRMFNQVDERLLDGLVSRVASITQSLGSFVRKIQNGLLSDYLWNAFLMVLLIIASLALLQ